MKIIDGTSLNATTFNRSRESRLASYNIWYDTSESLYMGESNSETLEDYTDATCKTVFDDIVDALPNGGHIHFRDGDFTTDKLLIDTNEILVSGNGKGTRIKPLGDNHVFEFQAPVSRSGLYNLQIDDTSELMTSKAAIYLDINGALGAINEVDIKNICMYYVYNGIESTDKAVDITNGVQTLNIENLRCNGYRNEAIILHDIFDSRINNVLVTQKTNAALHGLRLEDSADSGSYINDFTALGITTTTGSGMYIRDTSHVYGTNIICDTYDFGIITGLTTGNLIFNNTEVRSCDSNGLSLQSTGGHTIFNGLLMRDNVSAGAYIDDAGTVTLKNVISDANLVITAAATNRLEVDINPMSRVALDLSGGATDVVVYHADVTGQLVSYTILYTEASSADVDWAADAVRIGRYQDGVALDNDYFDETITEASKSLGYNTDIITTALTNKYIAVGDTITAGTGGGKTGTGEVMIKLHIVPNSVA